MTLLILNAAVTTANTIVNGGTIQSLLFGGGQGYSYTGTANLTIKMEI